MMNGLNAAGRGGGSNPGMPASRGQGAGLGGLSGLGPNLQRQPPQGMSGLNSLGQRGMPNLGLGAGSGNTCSPPIQAQKYVSSQWTWTGTRTLLEQLPAECKTEAWMSYPWRGRKLATVWWDHNKMHQKVGYALAAVAAAAVEIFQAEVQSNWPGCRALGGAAAGVAGAVSGAGIWRHGPGRAGGLAPAVGGSAGDDKQVGRRWPGPGPRRLLRPAGLRYRKQQQPGSATGTTASQQKEYGDSGAMLLDAFPATSHT